MARRKALAVIAVMTALALVGAACSKKEEGGTSEAGGCSGAKTVLQALGSRTTSVQAAGAFKATRVLGKSTKAVKIGFIGDLTGSNSSLVVPGRNAAKMAFEAAKAAGEANITLVDLDNKEANPSTAPALAQRLISDPAVMGVIGPAFSGETSAVQPLFSQAGLTHITQSATRADLTTKGYKTFFRSVGGDTDQAAAAGKLMAIAMKCKKVAVIDDKSAYGQGLAEIVNTELTKAGVSVVSKESVAPATDYTSLVDTLITKAPDGVFYGGYQPQASIIIKQMRQKGLKASFVSGDGSKSTKFSPDAGAAGEGALFTCPCLDPNVSSDAAAQKFASDFKAKFGVAPDIYGAEAYDVAQMFIKVISDCGDNVTRKCVLDGVTAIKDLKGLTKTFSWTTDPKLLHEVTDKGVNIYAVKSGTIVLLGPIQKFAA
jgi:branched-chain amino acid transport system substrate-binding protein